MKPFIVGDSAFPLGSTYMKCFEVGIVLVCSRIHFSVVYLLAILRVSLKVVV